MIEVKAISLLDATEALQNSFHSSDQQFSHD